MHHLISPENGIKEINLGNTRHVFMKSILHIFTGIFHSKSLSHLLNKEDGIWAGFSNNVVYAPTQFDNLF